MVEDLAEADSVAADSVAAEDSAAEDSVAEADSAVVDSVAEVGLEAGDLEDLEEWAAAGLAVEEVLAEAGLVGLAVVLAAG